MQNFELKGKTSSCISSIHLFNVEHVISHKGGFLFTNEPFTAVVIKFRMINSTQKNILFIIPIINSTLKERDSKDICNHLQVS